MMMFILFGGLMVISGVLLVVLLRPTRAEKAIQRQLQNIEQERLSAVDPEGILRSDELSSLPWLDDILRQIPLAISLSNLIQQGEHQWQVASLVLYSVIGGFAAAWIASMFLPAPQLGIAFGVLTFVAPYLYLYVRREARFRRFDTLLCEAVDLMARALRAGHAVTAVLEMVGSEVADPVGAEFRALAKEQSLGLPLREAMTNLLERMPRSDLRFLVTAILLQRESGGNLAQILDKTASVLRERARLRGQLKIYTAQGRLTGWILGFAPFTMFALISAFNPGYESILVTDPMGINMIYGGLVMMALGAAIIHKVMDIQV